MASEVPRTNKRKRNRSVTASPVVSADENAICAGDTLRRAWSAEEDGILRRLVLAGGARRWGDIAKELEGRSSKSCRLRWCNHLHPMVVKTPFTEEEDRHVVLSYAAHGPKWALMARGLPGRTDSAIKNHWHSTLKKNYSALLGKHLAGDDQHHQQLQLQAIEHDDDTSEACLSNQNPYFEHVVPMISQVSISEQDICKEKANGKGSSKGRLANIIFPPIVPLDRTSSDMTTLTSSQISSSSNSGLSPMLQGSSVPFIACPASPASNVVSSDTVLRRQWNSSLNMQMQEYNNNACVDNFGNNDSNRMTPVTLDEEDAGDIIEELMFSPEADLVHGNHGHRNRVHENHIYGSNLHGNSFHGNHVYTGGLSAVVNDHKQQGDMKDDRQWADLPALNVVEDHMLADFPGIDMALLQLLDADFADKVNSFPFLNSSGGLLEDIVAAGTQMKIEYSYGTTSAGQTVCGLNGVFNSMEQPFPSLQDSHLVNQFVKSEIET